MGVLRIFAENFWENFSFLILFYYFRISETLSEQFKREIVYLRKDAILLRHSDFINEFKLVFKCYVLVNLNVFREVSIVYKLKIQANCWYSFLSNPKDFYDFELSS